MHLYPSRIAIQLGKRNVSLIFGAIATASGALFRALPAILAWPYPLGYDTTASYLIQMTRPLPTAYFLFSDQALHDLLLSLLYRVAPSASNAFFILDAFAIAMGSILALEIYFYSRKVANLAPAFAFVTSIVFTFNLITLRLLWDQYRLSLGLIFVLLVFLLLSSRHLTIRWLALPLTVLVFLSNAVPATFLVLTLVISLVAEVFAKKPSKISYSSPLVWNAIMAVILEGFQVAIVKGEGNAGLPPNLVSQSVGIGVSAAGLLYFVYVAWPFLLLVPFAFSKDRNNYHSIWFVAVLLVAVILPLLGSAFVFLPIIWIYWLMSFPLSILFGVALQMFYAGGGSLRKKPVSNGLNILVGIALCALIILSISYAVSSPLAPDPYSVIGAPYAADQPLGYLQSTIPISQEANLVSVLNASLHVLPGNATIYLGEQFFGLTSVLPNPNFVHIISLGLIDTEANLTSLSSYGPSSYTVWWTHPTGWYGVDAIPSNFTAIITVGAFSLYKL
jgi:hypothetical protein